MKTPPLYNLRNDLALLRQEGGLLIFGVVDNKYDRIILSQWRKA